MVAPLLIGIARILGAAAPAIYRIATNPATVQRAALAAQRAGHLFSRLRVGVMQRCPLTANRLSTLVRGGPFTIHPRVASQLKDPRLGTLVDRLSVRELNRLVQNPTAQRLIDTKGNRNVSVIQQVGDKLVRITTANDKMQIISVGPIRGNQVANGIQSGRFIPLK